MTFDGLIPVATSAFYQCWTHYLQTGLPTKNPLCRQLAPGIFSLIIIMYFHPLFFTFYLETCSIIRISRCGLHYYISGRNCIFFCNLSPNSLTLRCLDKLDSYPLLQQSCQILDCHELFKCEASSIVLNLVWRPWQERVLQYVRWATDKSRYEHMNIIEKKASSIRVVDNETLMICSK